ncbi:MAG TPA: hypothetical protein PK110_05325 [Niabella sp.]|nr:hypothetical protein [Chitinophagaceae bacterium]HRN49034.1 hypothetical protein [Niabella sp.]HRO84226.1 hypothetical protein [Niabella sp.]HUN04288.1 hypothetical protein [Niabella sp.]
MRFLFLPFLLAFIFIAISSCQKNANSWNVNPDIDKINISIKSAAGWCAPGDSLFINKKKTDYTYFPSSCSDEGKLTTNNTNATQWAELIALLDIEKFKEIDLDECGVCFDGVDERIIISQGKFSHSIKFYNLNNEKLKPMKDFIYKLYEIRAGFKK